MIQGSGNNDDNLETAVVQGASSAEIRDLQVKSTGTTSLPVSIAILVLDADTRITNVTASGYGISSLQSGDVVIDHSEVAEPTSTVEGFAVYIGATRLHGGAVSAATAVCAGAYDEAFTFHAGPTCP